MIRHSERHLGRLSSPELRELDTNGALVVLPLGSMEQHGPHLPLTTDAIIADGLLDHALARLSPTAHVWRLPCLAYGKSNEHIGFPGTISLSHASLSSVLIDVAHSVREAGFERLAFLSGHGGNSPTMDVVARDLHAATGLTCFCIDPGIQFGTVTGISEQERLFGYHAGQIETSLMLVLAPDLVCIELAVAEFPSPDQDIVGLAGPARMAWITSDWSRSGVFGDATAASRELGEHMLDEISTKLAEILTSMTSLQQGVPRANGG